MTDALRFVIDWEPVDDSVRAAELRATWCRLELWVDGDCLTLAEDAATRSIRRGLAISLYPVAEWIAFNWYPLCYDGRDDGAPVRFTRRNLRSAGDGFLWPDCEFVPEGQDTMVRWSGGFPPGSKQLRYLGRGGRSLDGATVQRALADVVETVLARLSEEGVHETPLHGEWQALQSLDGDEAEFCVAAARLGLDPFSEGVELADEITSVAGGIEAELRSDFFDSASPAALGDAAGWLRETLAAVTEPPGHDIGYQLSDVAVEIGEPEVTASRPWVSGYDAARRLRQHLGVGPTVRFPDRTPIFTVPADRHRSFVAAGRRFHDRASLALPPASVASRRFAVARTMWHAAKAPATSAFLLTTSRSSSQSAGRAFAAELLAPAAGIRQLLGPRPDKAAAEDVEQVADQYGVASLVVEHQIDNQLRFA